MFLKRCLLAVSTLAAFASLALVDAKSALAIKFYDFQLDWSDGTSGTGSFSIDETAPTFSEYDYLGYSYDYKYWSSFVDFEFDYAGTSYTKADLNYSYLYDYTFPTTSYYYPDYGDSYQFFEFSLPNLYASFQEFAPGAYYQDSVYGYNYSTNAYVTSGSFQPRSTPVPTPALIPGLIGLGAAALRKRKSEAVEEALEPIEV